MAVRIRTAVGVPQRGKGGGAGRRPVTGDTSGGMPAGGLIFELPANQQTSDGNVPKAASPEAALWLATWP